MSAVGGMQDCSTRIALLLDAAMVNVCRREQSDARVMMLSIIPVEELPTELARLFEIVEVTGIR